MARVGRLGNVCLKKETTWGTYIAGDVKLRPTSESLARKVEHVEDAALVGELYTTKMVKVADGASGGIETSCHGDTAGIFLHSALGGEAAVSDPVNARVIFAYTGASIYHRVTVSSVAAVLSEVSTNGSSWTTETGFCTAGTLNGSSMTFTAITAAINTSTGGYHAVLLGDGTQVGADIPAQAATLTKSNSVLFGAEVLKSAESAATTAKTHTLSPADATASLPSYSITVNRALGTNASLGYTGSKISSLVLNCAAKDLVKMSLTWDCEAEEIDQTDIVLTTPTITAFTASNTRMVLVKADSSDMDEFDEVKNLSLTINTNVDDNRVVGSVYKKEQTRQGSTIELSFEANNTTTQYGYRSQYTADSAVECFIYIEGVDECDAATDVKYNIMIHIPQLKLTDYNSTLSTADRLTISAAGTAEKPSSTVNTKHLYAYVTDADTTTY